MSYIYLIPIVALLVMAPVIAVNSYLLAWMCGPAIRRAGRMFELGRMEARAAAEGMPGRPPLDGNHGARAAAAVESAPLPVIPVTPAPAAPGPDAGHRWLGATGKRA